MTHAGTKRSAKGAALQAQAITIQAPKHVELTRLALADPGADDLVVEVAASGISTGTERLIVSGEMPPFPGMGYPLVPGYESVGKVVDAADRSRIGDIVFVPGATCFGAVRGLFGANASHLVVPAARVTTLPEGLGERGVLLALAATAYHAGAGFALPDLIIGHGTLGRLLARIAIAQGGAPTVWDTDERRHFGAEGYEVLNPENDTRRDYKTIMDASGSKDILDTAVQRLARGGEIVLAGFYDRLSFAFAPAFMREVRVRIAAQWLPADIEAVTALVASGRLSLDNLITHRRPPAEGERAYREAFENKACLKMVIDWSQK
jgi:3-hydroxyethyl bacteriochlorophyllide a dehydrogenase